MRTKFLQQINNQTYCPAIKIPVINAWKSSRRQQRSDLDIGKQFQENWRKYFYQKDQSQNIICDGLMYNMLFVDHHQLYPYLLMQNIHAPCCRIHNTADDSVLQTHQGVSSCIPVKAFFFSCLRWYQLSQVWRKEKRGQQLLGCQSCGKCC